LLELSKARALPIRSRESMTIQNQKITWDRGIQLARILSVAALMSACGEDASPSTSAPSDDTATAYEALSASLQACEDQQDACVTAALGDAAKLAKCDSDAAACKQKTEAQAEHARGNLERDTNSCWKKCRHGDDDAGAANDDDGGMEDMHGCIEHHAPRLPRCIGGIVSCLHDAGLRKGDATRAEIIDCIQAADQCFRDEFAARRGHGGPGQSGGNAGRPAAGSPAPAAGSGGSSAGSPAAGSGGAGGSKSGRNEGRNPFDFGRNSDRGRH
jgi:hypothetical protein